MRSPTHIVPPICSYVEDFNPQAPCGARQRKRASREKFKNISIHRLLAEPDKTAVEKSNYFSSISIHRLLAEPDDTK